ncbi:MAG: hypothetical protein ACM3Q0_01670 [Bacteroidota bacterium]
MSLTVARTVLVSLSPMPAMPEACARAGDDNGGSNAVATNIRQAAGTPIEVIIRFGDNSIMLIAPRFHIRFESGVPIPIQPINSCLLLMVCHLVNNYLLALLPQGLPGAVEDRGRGLPRPVRTRHRNELDRRRRQPVGFLGLPGRLSPQGEIERAIPVESTTR